VLWGYGTREELESAQPELILEFPQELTRLAALL
jgi:phosphoglycolate phosphatase-like HAD superfamily hydrolase